MTFRILFPVLLVASASNAFAQSDSDIIDEKDVPELVQKQSECGEVPNFATRRAFGGGFIFALPCPSNHANQIKALVFAKAKDGAGAQLIKFPTPKAKETLSEISNVGWFPKTGEVSQLFVDSETAICRTEARWKLTGAKATLVHWRQTRDCKGRGGWVTLVNRR